MRLGCVCVRTYECVCEWFDAQNLLRQIITIVCRYVGLFVSVQCSYCIININLQLLYIVSRALGLHAGRSLLIAKVLSFR